MVGIDTNVLVRYVTEDDEIETSLAAKLIDKYLGAKNSIFINNIVVCELIWVLIRLYQYNKPEIINLLKEMLATIEFTFEDQSLLLRCVLDYAEKDADFADILIGNINLNQKCKTTFTFDKKASALKSFEIIG
jgi:predicted nucleic-acid-binding protein